MVYLDAFILIPLALKQKCDLVINGHANVPRQYAF